MIYAGFFDSGTSKGLPEGEENGRRTTSGLDRRDIDLATQIAASTRKVNRKGIYPEYSSASYIAIDEKTASEWRNSGFTTVHVMPSGELLNGTTTVVALTDSNRTAIRDSVLQSDYATAGGWRSSGRGYPTSMMGSVAHLRQSFLDGQHYQKSWEVYQRVKKGIQRPPRDFALESIGALLGRKRAIVFPASRIDEVYRAQAMASEFDLSIVLDGLEYGFEFVDELKSADSPVILRINFPEEPELGKRPARRSRGFGGSVRNTEAEDEIDKRIPVAKGVFEDRMENWESQVKNAATLAEAGIEFVFSTEGHEKTSEFIEHLQLAVEHGLSVNDALSALTVRPAKMFGLDDQLGTIEPGKIANLVVMDKEFQEEKCKVKYTIVNGSVFEPAKEKKKKGRKGKGDDEDDAESDDEEKKKGDKETGDKQDDSESDDEKESKKEKPDSTEA